MPATYAPGPRCNAFDYTIGIWACQGLNTRYLASMTSQPLHLGGIPVDIPADELGTGWALPGGNRPNLAYWTESSRARRKLSVETSVDASGEPVDTLSPAAPPAPRATSPSEGEES